MTVLEYLEALLCNTIPLLQICYAVITVYYGTAAF